MDLISHLPEPILHDILRRLSAEESMRTCVLSKRWRQIQSSCPFMNFGQRMFVGHVKRVIYHGDIMFHQLMNSMNASIDHFFSNPNSGHLLGLQLKLSSLYDLNKNFHSIHLWLNRAIRKGMRHLDLHFDYRDGFIYSLPQCLLHCASECLTHLNLSYCKFDIYYAGGNIKFPNLQSLSLKGIGFSNDYIKCLIFGCPLLEDLKIQECPEFTALTVTGTYLPRLERIALLFCQNLSSIEIGSQNFQSFRYGSKVGRFCKLNLACSHNAILRQLVLEYVGIRRDWLEQQILRCEELVTDRVVYIEHVKISSQKLTKLSIKSCRMPGVAEIDCPNLSSLVYTMNKFPFHSMNNSKLQDIRLGFILGDVWFDKLKDFFGNFSPKRDLIKIGISFADDELDVLVLDGFYESMFPIFHDIKHMNPTVTICSVSNSLELDNFLDGLFSGPLYYCHKALKVASTSTFCNSSTFSELIFDRLSKIKQGRYYCCERIYNCWGCDLFHVKQDSNSNNSIPDALRSYKFDTNQIIRLLLEWRTSCLF